MSHYTVLVIGPDPEKKLAPFHEFECTGVDDEFVQDIDITPQIAERQTKGETLEEALSWHGLEDRTVSDESQVDRSDVHKYGYAIVTDGKLVKAVDRTNPDKKWDWYQLGGRWAGMFKLREGASGNVGRPGLMTDAAARAHDRRRRPGFADAALKRDIDFEGMRNAAGETAGARYDEAMAVLSHIEPHEAWEPFRTKLLAEGLPIEGIRARYHAQPRVLASKNANEYLRWNGPDEFLVDRAVYVQAARDGAIATFAVIKDGEWFERGTMGWWACVSNGKSAEVWLTEFAALLDSLPDDTLLSVYDCHI